MVLYEPAEQTKETQMTADGAANASRWLVAAIGGRERAEKHFTAFA